MSEPNNVVPFHAPRGDDGLPLYTTPQERDAFCFDQGQDTGFKAGYRVGYGDARARYEMAMEAKHTSMVAWVTWGLVWAFAVGGVFGVGVCRLVWPLVEAGVLP